jgi:hypothetical protein
MPPKLFLPAVEVDVRPEGMVGVASDSESSRIPLYEFIVEDLPRSPNRGPGDVGDDLAERKEAVESCRNTPGMPLMVPEEPDKPDRFVCDGEALGTLLFGPGEPSDGRAFESGGGNFRGTGNNDFCFRLGIRKNVVDDEAEFVVVTAALGKFSPELPVDLDDSDSRIGGCGRAKEESDLSFSESRGVAFPLSATRPGDRLGSSKVTLLFEALVNDPVNAPSFLLLIFRSEKDVRRDFFVANVGLTSPSGCGSMILCDVSC